MNVPNMETVSHTGVAQPMARAAQRTVREIPAFCHDYDPPLTYLHIVDRMLRGWLLLLFYRMLSNWCYRL